MIEASTLEQVRQAVSDHEHIKVVGGGTKSALSADANLSTKSLSGVLEYEPSEYTFTALAGTPIREIDQMLAEHGQFLPFDALFTEAGATLGGTVASASSGAGRLRFGGVRDFLLGTRFVAGDGRVVFGGGKVVKNAAGFDLPKLMVGALGQFGVLVELTFKVFPRPEGFATLEVETRDFETAVETLTALANSPLEMFAMELEPPSRILLRIAGIEEAMPKRIERIREFVGADSAIRSVDDSIWQELAEMHWVPEDHALVKVPISPTDLIACESALKAVLRPVPRRYSVAGNAVYVAWPESLGHESLDLVECIGRSGLVLRGPCERIEVGRSTDSVFGDRLQTVLDPKNKFARFPVAIT